MTATTSQRRFLVVQLGDIGDLVLSTPALSALREKFPQAHIALLTTPHAAPIVDGLGLVDVIHTAQRGLIDKRGLISSTRQTLTLLATLHREKYDTTLFFHHLSTSAGAQRFALLARAAGSPRRVGLDNGRGFFLTEKITDHGFGAKHQADYWLQLVETLGADATPRPTRAAVDSTQADSLPAKTTRPRIAIHAGSGLFNPSRRWSPENFAHVADQLARDLNAEIVLVGAANDDSPHVKQAMQTPAHDFSGKTSLPQLAAILQTCDLFIGADSGVMHVASTANLPIVALFGSTNAQAWHPYTPTGRHVVISTTPECSPCGYVGDEVGALQGCAARTCIRMITPQSVVNAAKSLLNGDVSVVPATPVSTPPKPISVRQISILGVPVSVITYAEWMRLIGAWIASPSEHLHHVCTVNPEMIMIARRDPIFRYVLKRAALTVPDGVGLLWAAKQIGEHLPERVTGSDGVPRIAAEAAARGWSIFLLGAGEGIAEKSAAILTAQHPTLKIVGTYAGSPAPQAEDAIVERINAAGADILLVAYGAPEQDKWIARNSPRLHVKMAMGIGGTLDFIAGEVPRAPQSMQRMGLEWLYRLYLQPWRIKRMMRLPHFALSVLMSRKKPDENANHA